MQESRRKSSTSILEKVYLTKLDHGLLQASGGIDKTSEVQCVGNKKDKEKQAWKEEVRE